ncbi:hypothetical protein Slin_3732 [Spirosoma linguale DSM 74]|uniref:Uncharacterized protein n=1 Tax=Spirosoma linguale (strain ATCC 33905 / DSM 74 / LMG 10896 / Claus 1) TaxID=504472 RepID=D2QBZ6_SPILD|nr:hypothetical protein Slin_3732 [Spirosoma linguale DSM 74]
MRSNSDESNGWRCLSGTLVGPRIRHSQGKLDVGRTTTVCKRSDIYSHKSLLNEKIKSSYICLIFGDITKRKQQQAEI